ncbi:hypothetical protein EMPG_09522 [Blastomyces silverae]|uniref:Profilin n=1 Tax=Blastomyces silverae TaxID=2060906 RepID=A0A0H1BMX9_9EURO|nr:hypothetical protein EMPG_09522 [Blastomyces silverae]
MADAYAQGPSTWQDFYDRLKQYQGIDKAAIYSIETMSPCATTPGFTALPNEIAFLLKAFADASHDKLEEVETKGFFFAGEKYFFVRAETDPDCLIGRKLREGIVICKTLTTLFIAHQPPDIPIFQVNEHVKNWARYLIRSEAAQQGAS